MDSDLKFKEHSDSKIAKGMQMLPVIRRSYQFLDNIMFKLLFNGIVQVHLEYAALVWPPSSKCSIVNIVRVQRNERLNL